MTLDIQHIKKFVSRETSLLFDVEGGIDQERQPWFKLWPFDVPRDHSFTIHAVLDWRRIRLEFQPGKFAGELLRKMANADQEGRSAFRAILSDCVSKGGDIDFTVNGASYDFMSDAFWEQHWNRFSLYLSKGQLDLGADDGEPDIDIVCRWTGRFAAAITAILPLETSHDDLGNEMEGYPEGAVTNVQANRYERDRRNRAAAIAIHGCSCLACGIDMGSFYGGIAQGFIEVHHVTPVSEVGAGYVIDPVKDLVPLCPNCHAVAHRVSPPLSLNELKRLIQNH